MKFKNILIIFSLFILLMGSLSAICAANDDCLNNNTQQIDSYFVHNEIKPTSDSQDAIIGIVTKNVEGKDFASLQREINSSDKGDTIHLKNDIIQKSKLPIMINNSITIEGNGHTIDAKQKSSIFIITNTDLTLNNICFINGNDIIGGAIQIKNSTVRLTNCTFKNNQAFIAGAIDCDNGEVIITNSIFSENKETGENCEAGAIFNNNGNLIIDNSQFSENVGCKGAAIANYGNMTLTNCNLSRNCAESGVIYNSKTGKSTIKNTEFSYNEAIDGSAIYNNGALTIDSSQFKCNNGKNSAGTIYNAKSGHTTITNSIFINNRARYGGAINNERLGNVRIINSTFIENKGENSEAIYSQGTLYLENNNISDIIYIDKNIIDPEITSKVYLNLVNGTTIKHMGDTLYPYAILTDDNGNIIHDTRLKLFINGEEFNTTFNPTTKLHNTTFAPADFGEYNISCGDYSLSNLTINNYGKYYIVKKGTYSELNALIQLADGFLELPYDFKFDYESDKEFITGIEITKSICIVGNGHVLDGNGASKILACYDKDNFIQLKDISFVNGYSYYGGGAISCRDTNLLISNCYFQSNNVSKFGGAIYAIDSNVVIIKCQFIRNFALKNGGAVFSQDSGFKIINSLFIENKACHAGYSIYNNGTMKLLNSKFTTGDKEDYGIYNCQELYLKDCSNLDSISNYREINSIENKT